jgi:hypothetical protein
MSLILSSAVQACQSQDSFSSFLCACVLSWRLLCSFRHLRTKQKCCCTVPWSQIERELGDQWCKGENYGGLASILSDDDVAQAWWFLKSSKASFLLLGKWRDKSANIEGQCTTPRLCQMASRFLLLSCLTRQLRRQSSVYVGDICWQPSTRSWGQVGESIGGWDWIGNRVLQRAMCISSGETFLHFR